MAALRDASPSSDPDDVVVARIPDPNQSDEISMPSDTGDVDPMTIPVGELDKIEASIIPEPGTIARPPLANVAPSVRGFSFAELWADAEQDTVRDVEAAIAAQENARAVELCEALVARVLASAAGLFGTTEAPRDPAMIAILLGLNGTRYLAFRATVREARAGTALTSRETLAAYAFAIDARLARSSLR